MTEQRLNYNHAGAVIGMKDNHEPMNEKYLFRGKRNDCLSKEWVIGYYANVSRPMIALEESQRTGEWYWFDVDPATISQCTGLRDKNGTLIFEGDIIRTKEYGKDNGKGQNFHDYDTFAVVYHNASFCIENAERRFIIFYRSGTFEIIGNIHDNPELMEGSDRQC